MYPSPHEIFHIFPPSSLPPSLPALQAPSSRRPSSPLERPRTALSSRPSLGEGGRAPPSHPGTLRRAAQCRAAGQSGDGGGSD